MTLYSCFYRHSDQAATSMAGKSANTSSLKGHFKLAPQMINLLNLCIIKDMATEK